MSAELPYYFSKDEVCPPWFGNGIFNPKKYDPRFPFKPRGETYQLSISQNAVESPYDLRNLRIINPDEVKRSLQELEEANKDHRLPAICVIATGGTIASAMSGGNELVASVDIQQIFEFVGRFYKVKYDYSAFSFPTLIDSSQMKMDYDADIVITMSYLWKKMSLGLKKNFRGFLITHGTDTFAPSLTRISQMLGSNVEFAVGGVCAQETIEFAFTDVADNVGRAVATLEKLYEIGRKTVFGYAGGTAGGAYTPSGMLKISDTDIKGFDSPAMDLIIDASNVQKARQANLPFCDAYSQVRHPQLDQFSPVILRGFVNSRIEEAQMDIPPEEYARKIQALDPEVIVLIAKTYGSFTFDESQVDGIVAGAGARNILLFATNPFPTGSVEHRYSAALYLISQGAIPLHMLPHAAVVKLQYLAKVFGNVPEVLEAYMTGNNFVGEQPKIWKPKELSDYSEEKKEKLLAKLRELEIDIRTLGQPRESIPATELQVYP